ncbi:protein of unknown function [Pseudodesulfovibrio piezophilus C1TLV30]|uniref:Uncharacterized protein n=1 Tax=Pseudodesulfovibrio piezophilus (strain DSM 21447 / JCM 15486 / C1TLV30) TaxID=1322246 RepID=M1WPU4_PSEP2|nr:protein of unknown function [Pseudodesulfovibrio piezophilus C1TLV30]
MDRACRSVDILRLAASIKYFSIEDPLYILADFFGLQKKELTFVVDAILERGNVKN